MLNDESEDDQSLQNLSQGIPLQGGDFYQQPYLEQPQQPINHQLYSPDRFLVTTHQQQASHPSLNPASTSFLTSIAGGQPFYLPPALPTTTNLTSSSVFLLPNHNQ